MAGSPLFCAVAKVVVRQAPGVWPRGNLTTDVRGDYFSLFFYVLRVRPRDSQETGRRRHELRSKRTCSLQDPQNMENLE